MYVGSIKCGAMNKYTLCQLAHDGRGRSSVTVVMDPASPTNPYPTQCTSAKECVGLVDFEVRYVGGLAGIGLSHGPPSALSLPADFMEWLKGFDEVINVATTACQSRCSAH